MPAALQYFHREKMLKLHEELLAVEKDRMAVGSSDNNKITLEIVTYDHVAIFYAPKQDCKRRKSVIYFGKIRRCYSVIYVTLYGREVRR